MTLPASPPISWTDICTEFGLSPTTAVWPTDFYGKGGAPSSGSLSFSDFLGRSGFTSYTADYATGSVTVPTGATSATILVIGGGSYGPGTGGTAAGSGGRGGDSYYVTIAVTAGETLTAQRGTGGFHDGSTFQNATISFVKRSTTILAQAAGGIGQSGTTVGTTQGAPGGTARTGGNGGAGAGSSTTLARAGGGGGGAAGLTGNGGAGSPATSGTPGNGGGGNSPGGAGGSGIVFGDGQDYGGGGGGLPNAQGGGSPGDNGFGGPGLVRITWN